MSHLIALAPLIGIMAAERTKDRPDLFEEARQEGLIKAWQVEEAHPDASRQYVAAAARRAVGDVLRGRPSFGEESHRGRQDAADYSEPLTFDDESGEDESTTLADPAAAAALARVEISDVRRDVRAAVADLDPEDFDLTYSRFWREQTWPEIAVETGKRTEAVRRRFVDHIAPALAEDLAHLRSAA